MIKTTRSKRTRRRGRILLAAGVGAMSLACGVDGPFGVYGVTPYSEQDSGASVDAGQPDGNGPFGVVKDLDAGEPDAHMPFGVVPASDGG